MNVKELIEELDKYERKDAEVYIYDGEDIDILLVAPSSPSTTYQVRIFTTKWGREK
tara:strand:- start:395 stop:562 length:168 start_codon:yes stop_codon:yes gene_type:complete